MAARLKSNQRADNGFRVYGDTHKPQNRNPFLPQHPCRIQVSGPSGSGKTNWLLNLVLHPDSPWDCVYLFYAQHQHKYEVMAEENKKRIESGKGHAFALYAYEGLPEGEELDRYKAMLEENAEEGCQQLLIFDDLMAECARNPFVTNLAVAGVHHLNLSTCYLTQNIFLQGQGRTQRLQLDYLVLYDFPVDRTAIRTVMQQVAPGKVQEAMEAFRQATEKPHSFLMLDFKCARLGRPLLKVRDNSWDKVFAVEGPDGKPQPPF